MIFEFKVTLRDMPVPVWRTIQLDSESTFNDLHELLQVVFDWDDVHLHSFTIQKSNGMKLSNLEITPANSGQISILDEHDSLDEQKELLSDWFKVQNDVVLYTYDFGDDWRHVIKLSKILQPDPDQVYPRCIKAKNLVPEEDSFGEVIKGNVNLTYEDSQQLVNDINQKIEEYGLHNTISDTEDDYWPEILEKSKELLQLKPWNWMDDESIFLVIDPITNQKLFCSILGAAKETFGLAVYIGKDGYDTLWKTLSGEFDPFHVLIQQRSLLLSFEDREDLDPSEYQLIKKYNTSFRGRKSWPIFISFKPGYSPWHLDQEETRLLSVALEQVLEVCIKTKKGLTIPKIYEDLEILALVPSMKNEDIVFASQIIPISQLFDYSIETKTELAVSAFELKKAEKLQQRIPLTIEYYIGPIEMPVSDHPNQRPYFPHLIILADHDSELAIEFQIFSPDEVNLAILQGELLQLFNILEGIPQKLIMNEQAYQSVKPIIERFRIQTEVTNDLPVVEELLEGFIESSLF
ncbi:plasmid pRiA4b ORF-3 family protein [Bacillaceae bacterium W0354]